jgi:hypothetical protein
MCDKRAARPMIWSGLPCSTTDPIYELSRIFSDPLLPIPSVWPTALKSEIHRYSWYLWFFLGSVSWTILVKSVLPVIIAYLLPFLEFSCPTRVDLPPLCIPLPLERMPWVRFHRGSKRIPWRFLDTLSNNPEPSKSLENIYSNLFRTYLVTAILHVPFRHRPRNALLYLILYTLPVTWVHYSRYLSSRRHVFIREHRPSLRVLTSRPLVKRREVYQFIISDLLFGVFPSIPSLGHLDAGYLCSRRR